MRQILHDVTIASFDFPRRFRLFISVGESWKNSFPANIFRYWARRIVMGVSLHLVTSRSFVAERHSFLFRFSFFFISRYYTIATNPCGYGTGRYVHRFFFKFFSPLWKNDGDVREVRRSGRICLALVNKSWDIIPTAE